MRRWQTLIIEDADRVTERGADALLKAIEEPAPRTVWMLCAPTPDDVVVTLRSRCRQVPLVTPSEEAVTTILTSEGIPPTEARFAARVCHGHIGRARALAKDPEVARQRRDALEIPAKLTNLGVCLEAAAWAVTTSGEQAAAVTGPLDAEEKRQLSVALGLDPAKATPRGSATAMKDLEEQQALRAKRFVRDRLDSILTELTGYYRDVLMVQSGAGDLPVNTDCLEAISHTATTSSPEATLRRIDAIVDCRAALAGNVAPQLALEALMVALA